MDSEHVDVPRFRQILANAGGERDVVRFLREHPWIAYWTFCPYSGHDRYAIFEFPLGNEYKSDLLLLNSYSGAWEALFIEFEPIDDPVFTKSGTPSKRLAIAQRQIDDWRAFASRHPGIVRNDMVRYAKGFDRLGYSKRGGTPCNFSNDLLSDPESVLLFRFKIVIGRSSRLNKEQRHLLGRYSSGHDAEIVSYDRLLHLAERRYEGKHRGDVGILSFPK